MQNNFYAILPHPTDNCILLLLDEGRWSIPVYHPKSSWTPQVHTVNIAVQENLGITPAVVRYCIQVKIERAEGKRYASAVYVMLSPAHDWTPPEGAHWATLEEFRALAPADDWTRPYVEAHFAEEASGMVPPLRPPWGYKGWYGEISAWAEQEMASHGLHPVGPLQQFKQWDISSVLKVATEGGGDLYVKAIPTIFATEPRITEGLARLFPEVVPNPLATWERPNEGRLLVRDFQGKLLWDEDMDWTAMAEALGIFARMQIECVSRTEDLFAMGCRDRRIEGLAQDFRALLADDAARSRLAEGGPERLEAIVPVVEQICAQLLSGSVPQTLMHGDFHGGNVALTDDGYVIFDWTDACVCHPFFDLLTVVDSFDDSLTEEKRERYLSAYLGEWEAAGYGSSQDLRATCELARKVGPLYHAISYWQIDKISEQATLAELGTSMAHFLRMMLARLETK